MNDFLLKYYRQLHFNSMPAEIRAQFNVYAKGDDFRGNMKSWKSDLMHRDPSGKWVNNALPDPAANGMTDAEWDKLFNALRDAFQAMNANRSKFKEDKKTTEFLDDWFGPGKLFTNAQPSPAAQAQIPALIRLLQAHERTLAMKLQQWNLVDSDFTYQKLVDGLTGGKYKTDPAFQEKLTQVARYLTYYTNGTNDPALQAEIGVQNFSDIENGFQDNSVSAPRRDYLKGNYDILLRTLYTNKKAYDVFKQYDNGKISKQLAKAIEKTDYTNKDSKDYVPPKRTDELTLGQQISNWWGDTYADVLEKFVKLRGDQMFIKPEAQTIVGAIHGAKIKPTDGLKGVLDKAGDIEKKLQYKSPKAVEAFQYFVKTMKDLQSTMPKAFEKALSHGSQRRALVEEMVMTAVRDGKKEQAKIAMEILSVIRYGWTTSKTMDALAKENLSIFSDPSLSWNKTEGIKFVTTAFDKSLKTAFMGVGYAITIAGNKIHARGAKFNGKRGRIRGAQDAWRAQNDADKNAAIRARDDAVAQRNAEQQRMDTIDQQYGINATTIGAHEQQLNNDQQTLATYQNTIDNLQTQMDDATQKKTDLEQNTLPQFRAWLRDPANINHPQRPQVEQQYRQLRIQRVRLWQQLRQDRATLAQEQQNRDALQTSVDDQIDHIAQFHDAQDNVNFLGERVQQRNDELNGWDAAHRDEYNELMAHWDFLETGHKTRSWTISKKRAQQKFSANIAPKLRDWYQNHQYAA